MVNKDYHSSNGTECINNIALHQAQLVVRWVIIHVYTILVCNQQLRPTQSSTLVGMWWSWSKFELSSRLTPFISYTPLFQAAPQNTPLPSSFYYSHWHAPAPPIHLCDYTHTHKHFYGFLDFVQDNPGELIPEGTLRHLLDFLEQNKDNTDRCTNSPDGLPLHPDKLVPHLCHLHHFYAGCPSLHKPPNLSRLGTGTK